MSRGPVSNQRPAREPASLRIALVGEAPGDTEVRTGIPFSGAAGCLLNSALSSVSLSREECFVGNVSQWRPSATGNDFSLLPWDGAEVQDGIAALLRDLSAWRPNIVVCLGNVPLHLFKHGNVAPPKTPKSGYKWPSAVTKWRGSLFLAHESLRPGEQPWKTMPTWHPAFVLRVYSKLFDLRQDLLRARQEGHTPTLTLDALDIRWGPERVELPSAAEPSTEPVIEPAPATP